MEAKFDEQLGMLPDKSNYGTLHVSKVGGNCFSFDASQLVQKQAKNCEQV